MANDTFRLGLFCRSEFFANVKDGIFCRVCPSLLPGDEQTAKVTHRLNEPPRLPRGTRKEARAETETAEGVTTASAAGLLDKPAKRRSRGTKRRTNGTAPPERLAQERNGNKARNRRNGAAGHLENELMTIPPTVAAGEGNGGAIVEVTRHAKKADEDTARGHCCDNGAAAAASASANMRRGVCP